MTSKLPLYHKLSVVTIGLFVFFYIVYLGQDILIPLTFAWILAILLNPIVNLLVRKKVNRVIAIFLAILLMLVVLGGILFFICSQISMFSDSFPEIKEKVTEILNNVLVWVSDTFNVHVSKIKSWIEEQKGSGMRQAGGVIGTTIGTVSGILTILLLLPVYIFLFLFYKPLLLDFIARLFSTNQHNIVAEVLSNIKILIQNYLMGLMIEMFIVASMNSAALLIIGIKYGILLGIIGAILNLIPYIGGVVAIALPMIMGLLTDDPMSALYVLIAYIVIQIIDNNLLVPKIVASKVKVNALVSIVVVLIGGALWGVAGMFLSIPLTAIIKVIFDRIPTLEAFGFLIGDSMPDIGKSIFNLNYKKEKNSIENSSKHRIENEAKS